jgi:hypothetical protein
MIPTILIVPLYVDRRCSVHGGPGAESALAESADPLVTCVRHWSIIFGVRRAWDLPRSRLAWPGTGPGEQLRAKLRHRAGACRAPGSTLRLRWPASERVGFVGEARFGLINRWRWGEKALPRFIDKNAALALPDGAPLPGEWPVPQLRVPAEEAGRWRQANGLGTGPAVALAPGSVGASKRWTTIRKPQGCWPNGAGCLRSAAPAKRRWRRRRPRRPRPPAPICATASWRWRRPRRISNDSG